MIFRLSSSSSPGRESISVAIWKALHHQINGFVGQEAIGNIPAGQFHRGDHGIVFYAYAYDEASYLS